jgi:hypothetical protein
VSKKKPLHVTITVAGYMVELCNFRVLVVKELMLNLQPDRDIGTKSKSTHDKGEIQTVIKSTENQIKD